MGKIKEAKKEYINTDFVKEKREKTLKIRLIPAKTAFDRIQ